MSIATTAPATEQMSAVPPAAPRFHVVSVPKFICMMSLTWGCYATYWYYRQWLLNRGQQGFRFVPLLLCLLGPLALYPLLNRVAMRARACGKHVGWTPRALCSMFWLSLLMVVGAWGSIQYMALTPIDLKGLGWMVIAFMLSMMFSLIPLATLVMVQQAINVCEGDALGASNARFTLANCLWVIALSSPFAGLFAVLIW